MPSYTKSELAYPCERELFVCAKMFSHYLVKRVSSAPIGTIFKCACNLAPLDFWFSVTSALVWRPREMSGRCPCSREYESKTQNEAQDD